MILNPYDTSLGMHVNTKKLESILNEFMIKGQNTDNLNYEYKNNEDVSLVFITGKNEDEVMLPVWNHPLFIKDFRGRKKIFVDIRQYVRMKNKEFTTLDSIVNNRPGFDFIITKTLYMMLLSSNKRIISNIDDKIALSFSMWISTSFRSVLTLGVEETIKLEIIAMHYMLCLIADEKQDDNTIENIYFKISKSLKSVRGNVKYIKETCNGLNNNPDCAVDLTENIGNGLSSPLLANLDTVLLYNVIGNTWNGVNASENIVMAFDHIPTLIALIYVSANNKSYKHSKLANILNTNKRSIGLDDFSKTVSLTIKDNM